MPGPMLYSTQPYFAVDVARRYRKDRYYAWCSEVFYAGQEAGSAGTRMVAASSDPKTIYEQLHIAVCSEDRHDSRIKGYRKTFKRLAASWRDAGEITKEQGDEITAACGQNSFRMWRPLLFIIPRGPVEIKLTSVPPSKRAGHGNEFILADLDASEFDMVELPSLRER